ncbi:hypothetical protein ACCO45_013297 [Purpureocillium lilacinum]|uniref:Uncharacterized protein n=1 Tax=Purpureocillium lilacinum TaxID=33203 RepID=A0ACC4DCN6_PURLI
MPLAAGSGDIGLGQGGGGDLTAALFGRRMDQISLDTLRRRWCLALEPSVTTHRRPRADMRCAASSTEPAGLQDWLLRVTAHHAWNRATIVGLGSEPRDRPRTLSRSRTPAPPANCHSATAAVEEHRAGPTVAEDPDGGPGSSPRASHIVATQSSLGEVEASGRCVSRDHHTTSSPCSAPPARRALATKSSTQGPSPLTEPPFVAALRVRVRITCPHGIPGDVGRARAQGGQVTTYVAPHHKADAVCDARGSSHHGRLDVWPPRSPREDDERLTDVACVPAAYC